MERLYIIEYVDDNGKYHTLHPFYTVIEAIKRAESINCVTVVRSITKEQYEQFKKDAGL